MRAAPRHLAFFVMALGEPRIERLGRLAQLGERLPYKQEVTGSNPVPPICPLQDCCGSILALSTEAGTNGHMLARASPDLLLGGQALAAPEARR